MTRSRDKFKINLLQEAIDFIENKKNASKKKDDHVLISNKADLEKLLEFIDDKIHTKIQNEVDDRVNFALEKVLSLARLDFSSDVLQPNTGNDSIDALFTGLNMLEEELQYSVVSKNELELVTNNFPGAISRVNSKGQYTYLNDAYAEWLCFSPKKTIGKTHKEVLPKETYEKIEKNIKAALAGKSLCYETETVISGDKKIVARVNLVPNINNFGKPDGFFTFIEDITDQVLAQQKLVQSEKMSSLGEMASGIAHEVNNPLTIVIGNAEHARRLIESGQISKEKLSGYLSNIEITADRIAQIIRGLLSFSRPADNDPMVATKVIKIITDTLSICNERLNKHGFEIKINCDEELKVACRSTQISQIILNLIGNSIDALLNEKNKWISVDVESDLRTIKLKFTDSGKGISNEVVEKIMNPFFTTKSIGKGTGLGLSISRGIAEEHHGSLRYNTESDHTSFILELPIKQPVSKSSSQKTKKVS